MPTGSLIDRIRKTLDVNESRYDLTDKERFHNNLVEYTFFAKKVLTQMKQLKKNVETFKTVKNQSITHNKVFFHLVDKYEELNLTQYLDGNLDKIVFLDPKNKELKDQMDHMVDNLKNPFDEMYHWCKGEIYDLQSLCDAIAQRDKIE